MAGGDDDSAQKVMAQLDLPGTKDPLGGALVSLARLHMDSEAAGKHAAANEAAFDRIAAHLPLIGRIHAEFLARVSPQRERWTTILHNMGMQEIIAFIDIIGFKPRWERAFERLAAFLELPATAASSENPSKPRKRLVFLVDPQTNEVEALEQAFKGRTWTPGRPVAMKRLSEQDPKLDYLTAADRRVLQTIRKNIGWYDDTEYAFDEYKSLLALVGHPNVFDPRDRRHVELVAYPAELVVSETPSGYRFMLSHRARQPEVFLEQETPARWRVIELSQKLVALQATLGDDGLVVPPQLRERVVALLRTDNAMLPIRSELPDVEVAAVEGATTPVLRLRRSGEAFSVALMVRPLGPDGPSYVPGHGGQSVLAMANGIRRRVHRDLAAEIRAAEHLIAACPTLQPWNTAPHEWQIDDLEATLGFLEQLHSSSIPVTFEWPGGRNHQSNLSHRATSRALLKVSSQRDWFEISGRITVDEDLVLDPQDLLAQTDKARGRFVPLDDGRFLALTADLKRQLQQLDAISDHTRGSPTGTPPCRHGSRRADR